MSVLDVHDHAAHPVGLLEASFLYRIGLQYFIDYLHGWPRQRHLVNIDPVMSRHVGQTTTVGRRHAQGRQMPSPLKLTRLNPPSRYLVTQDSPERGFTTAARKARHEMSL